MPRGRRRWSHGLGGVLAAFGVLLMVAGASCSQSASDSSASASGEAVIFGRVLSASGVPARHRPAAVGVAGVTVTVRSAAGSDLVSSATSGPDGNFRFTLAPGDYAVAGAGNPHLVHVDAGQRLEVNLYLPNPAAH